MRTMLMIAATWVAAGAAGAVSAAGHYCDEFEESERPLCMSARVRGDDDCTRISDPMARLACWDQERAGEDCTNKYLLYGRTEAQCLAEVFGENPEQATDAIAKAGDTGAWRVDVKKSDFTDDTNVFVSIAAEERARCAPYDPPPSLYLRCVENKTSVFVAHGCYTPTRSRGEWPVQFRVDDRPMAERPMKGSSDNEALGFWQYPQSRYFIEGLFDGDVMRVRFSDYNGTMADLTFPISGIEAAVAPLREACGW